MFQCSKGNMEQILAGKRRRRRRAEREKEKNAFEGRARPLLPWPLLRGLVLLVLRGMEEPLISFFLIYLMLFPGFIFRT